MLVIKKIVILLLGIFVVFSILGCGSVKSSKINASKKIPKTQLVDIGKPASIAIVKNGTTNNISSGAKYKDTVNYFGNLLSEGKLKPTNLAMDDNTINDIKLSSVAFAYNAPQTITFNFADGGRKDVKVVTLAFLISGKHKGYVFIGDSNKNGQFFEKINIPKDIDSVIY